jgi:ubiquinone biosynthesis protein Coq4
VISLDQGIYTLRSDTLGQIQIPAAKIESISTREQANTLRAPAQSGSTDIDDLRESLAQDPDTMGKIQTLQNDPLVKDILNDEATMRAINAGDLTTLMNDPKIKALMEHSTVQDITRSGGL